MAVLKTTLTCLLLSCGAAMAGEQATTVAPADTAAKPAVDPATASAKADEGASTEPTGAEGTSPLKKQCEAISGSRIRPSTANDCKSAHGPMRTYTNEDLQRTGEIDINEALRKLDTIFR